MLILLLLAVVSLDALADHPALVAGVEPFHRYISSESSLPARDREILILRIAALSRSAPIWNDHVPTARDAGLTATDIARAGGMPDDPQRAWIGGLIPARERLDHQV